MLPRVGIIYLSYHSEPHIPRAVEAVKQITYPKDRLEFIIVDNPHPEFGSSMEFIRKQTGEASETSPVSPPLWEEGRPLAASPFNKGEAACPPSACASGAGRRGRESRDFLPRVTILPQEKNLGFAGGNNVGIRTVLEFGCKYVYLHNQDGFIAKDCLEKLVEAMENDRSIGAAQSLILLYPETHLINTVGNQLHFLAFGYSGGLRRPVSEARLNESHTSLVSPLEGGDISSAILKADGFQSSPLRGTHRGCDDAASPVRSLNIAYASGASIILRADLLQKHGLLDEDFFAYHEDLEYSLRIKSLGYKTVVVPDAKFFHEYSFSHNKNKYYLMERNRFATILMYYKWPTILLLLPVAVPVEIGLCFIAWWQGWWLEKWRAYGYWLKPSVWRRWLGKRKRIQSQRKISDRQLLALATGVIQFDDQAIDNPILKYIANPVMRGYWWVVWRLIVW